MTQPISPFARSLFAATALVFAPVLTGCDTAPSDPLAAAQAAMADGAPRIAMEHLNNAIDADPANADLRMMAGDLAIALGNPDRAVSEFERLVEGSSSSSLGKAKLAEAYLLGNYMRAAREARDGFTFDVPYAYTAAIAIDMADGEVASAFDRLEEGLAKFPQDPRLVTIDAERMLAMAERGKASARLQPVLSVKPAVAQAHMLAGQMALEERALDKAESYFETVLKVYPAQQTAMLAMAAIARDRGDDQAAVEWVDKTGGTGTTHPIGVLFLAQMAYDGGNVQQAYELIETVPPQIASEPAFARLRGFIDAGREQHGAAILALKDYAKDNPNDIMAQRVLAQSYAAENEPKNAWATIAPVIDHPQADGGTLLFALRMAEETGQGDPAAIRARMEQVGNAPDISEQMLAAGDAIRAGNWAEADAIYAPLVEGSGKNDPALLNNAAAMKSKLGDYAKAVTLARRAYAIAPESPIIQDTLGWALWNRGGASAEAKALLTQAREAAPNNREIAEHWTAAHAAN